MKGFPPRAMLSDGDAQPMGKGSSPFSLASKKRASPGLACMRIMAATVVRDGRVAMLSTDMADGAAYRRLGLNLARSAAVVDAPWRANLARHAV